MHPIFTARKPSLRRLCFYTCLLFCSQEGGGWSRPRSRVQVKGSGQVGCLGPHPGGRLGGSGWEGGFRPTPGDGGVSQHALRQTPQQTATAAGGTHPTGMPSYLPVMLQMTNTCMLCVCCSWDWE